MKHPMRTILLISVCLLAPLGFAAANDAPAAVTGRVFDDANGNGVFDPGETPLSGVGVSNGADVVQTDEQGLYRLAVGNDTIVFVIKPSGFRTPLSHDNLPRFYYIHKPGGSPPFRFEGVKPTGPLPESVDFALRKQEEPDRFEVILFGDTQSRDQTDLGYLTRDVLPGLVGTSAAFGVTLGDVVFDNPALFEPQAEVIGRLGIPWYNVMGNHDINYDAKEDALSDETFERVFGPPYYGFDYGKVHFVVLDDIEWIVNPDTGKGSYRGGLGERQLEFLKNDLALVPEDRLVVLMMHIPINVVNDREPVYRLIENRPHCISISGHTHTHEHRMLGEADGWRGAKPHHHIVNVTACGNWWNGVPDERGIPHTMMSDGAPNGYTILAVDGVDYSLDFRAASRPAGYQMEVHLPDVLEADRLGATEVVVNVFNGSPRSTVRMRIGGGEWIPLEPSLRQDPAFVAQYERDQAIADNDWRDLGKPHVSTHIWAAPLPETLPLGVHVVEVETTDMHGRTFSAKRIIRIK